MGRLSIEKLGQRLLLSGVGILWLAAPAWATAPNLVSFKKAYPAAQGISCKTCHQNAVGRKGDLNPYGLAVELLQVRTLPRQARRD